MGRPSSLETHVTVVVLLWTTTGILLLTGFVNAAIVPILVIIGWELSELVRYYRSEK